MHKLECCWCPAPLLAGETLPQIFSSGKWYFSGINRSEEKYFRFCCVHGKVKVVRNQVYRRSKVVLGVLRVLSTLVVGFSVKKGPILLLKLRKVIVFFCELRKTLFSVLTRKKRTFLLHQEMGPFLLNTQQHRWTTLAHQELPCSCDKLDFWHFLLFHGGNSSGKIFPRIYRCRRNAAITLLFVCTNSVSVL